MKVDVLNLLMKKVSDIKLDEEIFGVKPRGDILARVVHWQLARRQAGTHHVKERWAVQGSTRKIVRQKGSGGARHGAKRAAQFRGGGIIFGPISRSHAYKLPKKIRALAIKMALSAKAMENNLIIVEDFEGIIPKAKYMKGFIEKVASSSILLMDVNKSEKAIRASGNLREVDMLPTAGANVYDILRKEKLVLSLAAIKALEERLK